MVAAPKDIDSIENNWILIEKQSAAFRNLEEPLVLYF